MRKLHRHIFLQRLKEASEKVNTNERAYVAVEITNREDYYAIIAYIEQAFGYTWRNGQRLAQYTPYKLDQSTFHFFLELYTKSQILKWGNFREGKGYTGGVPSEAVFLPRILYTKEKTVRDQRRKVLKKEKRDEKNR